MSCVKSTETTSRYSRGRWKKYLLLISPKETQSLLVFWCIIDTRSENTGNTLPPTHMNEPWTNKGMAGLFIHKVMGKWTQDGKWDTAEHNKQRVKGQEKQRTSLDIRNPIQKRPKVTKNTNLKDRINITQRIYNFQTGTPMKHIKYKIKTQYNGQKCQALGFTISFWKVLHSACE